VLVLDTSVAEEIAAAPARRSLLRDDDLVAPPLLWSEARSNLHERVHRRELERALAVEILVELESGWLRPHAHPQLTTEAWRVADELGWLKTYDAEFVALAHLLGCRLVTTDGRLRRGAERLVTVVSPGEI
jgi:predicted nucleic acid-binding protein